MPKPKSVRNSLLAAAVLLLAGLPASSQNPKLQTKNGRRFPTVVFTFVLWAANPSYYSIAIDSTGNATYESAPDSVSSTGVPYTVEFLASDSTHRTVFDTVRHLDYLRRQFKTSLGFPEITNVDTLSYYDGTIYNQITYSSSDDPGIRQMTLLFEKISETLEFGRRLGFLRQHDKSALDAELARMQTMAKRGRLAELQAVGAVLHQIATDRSLEETVRSRAEQLANEAMARS